VVIYHRLCGRLTVLLAFGHFCFYVILERISDPVIYTGLISLGCGVVIVLSSLNYLRPKVLQFVLLEPCRWIYRVYYWSVSARSSSSAFHFSLYCLLLH
jgi:hypothetical protein